MSATFDEQKLPASRITSCRRIRQISDCNIEGSKMVLLSVEEHDFLRDAGSPRVHFRSRMGSR